MFKKRGGPYIAIHRIPLHRSKREGREIIAVGKSEEEAGRSFSFHKIKRVCGTDKFRMRVGEYRICLV